MKGTRKSILIAVCALVAVGLMLPAFAQDKADFVGNAQCKMCHNKKTEGAQWDQWHGTKHATALQALSTDAAKELAKKAGVAGDPAAAPECVRCHVTAYDAEKKASPEKLKAADGVQCEACHGPASLHIADAKKNLATKKIDPSLIIAKPDEKTCTKCHNQESPTFKGFDFAEYSKKIAHPNPTKAKAEADDQASPAKKDEKRG